MDVRRLRQVSWPGPAPAPGLLTRRPRAP